MIGLRLFYVLICLSFTSCFNKIRDDGFMAVGDSGFPMIYFESNKEIYPFISEIIIRFGQPNGKDLKFKSRLVWEDLENKELYNQPVRMIIDTSRHTSNGVKFIKSVSIVILDQNEENILIKKTKKQKLLKKYFQKIINEYLK